MSPVTDEYTLRTSTDDDFAPILEMVSGAFGEEVHDEMSTRERLRFTQNRDYVVVAAEGEIVGNAGSHSATLTVPGARVPAALVTAVAVRATDRRRGLLRRLMNHQLTELQDAGQESIAVLWASEGRIYQRFGYGLSTRNANMRVESRELSLRRVPECSGTLRTVEPASARQDLEQVYSRALPQHPGWFSRSENWWSACMIDPASARKGASKIRATLYSQDGRVDGYVLWRFQQGFSPSGPKGEVLVLELATATPEAHAALWQHLLTMDLTRIVTVGYSAIDDAVVHMVNEPRRLQMRVADGLWLRIVDLPSALAARRYAAAVDVVLEVSDEVLPTNAGRWRLRVGDDGWATCDRCVTAEPDLACDIADLGAIYLGGTRLGALVDAGRVRELRPDALRRTSAAVGWHREPSPFEMF